MLTITKAVSELFMPLGMVLALVIPFTWGALTGLALCVWAYEQQTVRRDHHGMCHAGHLSNEISDEPPEAAGLR